MLLNDIYPNFKNENTQYECKAVLDRKNTLGWLKTVAGFSNSNGGMFFIGVENGSNILIGFDSKQLDKENFSFIMNFMNIFLLNQLVLAILSPTKRIFSQTESK